MSVATSTSSFEWDGYHLLDKTLARLANPDPRPVLEAIEDCLVEGNRLGVLNGLDKNGVRMAPVTYRSSAKKFARTRTRNYGTTKGVFKGFGPLSGGLHGNLTTAQYRQLSGPPLAPRGEQSRVIANFVSNISSRPAADGGWFVSVGWADVVSSRGFPFLHAHFAGVPRRHLPKRDLAGIRPTELRKVEAIVAKWAQFLVSGSAA